jgi:hypothetical protein
VHLFVVMDCVDSKLDQKLKSASQGGTACESESGKGMPVCLFLCWPAAEFCTFFFFGSAHGARPDPGIREWLASALAGPLAHLVLHKLPH